MKPLPNVTWRRVAVLVAFAIASALIFGPDRTWDLLVGLVTSAGLLGGPGG